MALAVCREIRNDRLRPYDFVNVIKLWFWGTITNRNIDNFWNFRFLEDGDLYSENKRQRQFKWKGLDVSLELDRRDSDQEEEGDEVTEQIEQSTLQRLQREKWLKGIFSNTSNVNFITQY